MPFRTPAVLSGAVLAAAAVLLWPAPALARPAAPGWSAAPAPGGGARPSAQDRPYFYLEGAPGAVLDDRLALTNPSRRPVTVRLSGSGTGGRLAFAAAEVTLPPRTRAGVPFTLAVPAGAVPGSRSGTITATATAGGGAQARVPLHLRVTGPALSALTVEGVSVVRGSGDGAVVRYALVNRGNTVLRPRVALRADGIFGATLHRPARPLPDALRPGQRIDRTEKWPDPPALEPVEVRVTATAGQGARGAASATYTAVPWGAAAGAAAVLAAGAGTWGVVRRRRRTRRGRDGAGPTAAARTATGTASGSVPVPGSGVRA
ncbi:hypothetical protein [Streptomyces gilvosporeus]|uniref:DUF916 domain-containing protein n=1 Tax=Streptomyces gilvosporeus TaxID=553510 RepID=A0A1V0TSH6_9ACTN|nr:hypothetical protein [Streptomyces gilvosporeus]ARF55642.1 hypothetical protein B1H19_16950 [Streptomyces gilvosporeus]